MPADSLAEVGVAIVTYRAADVISEALLSLPMDRLAGVCVVDNASPDATVATVRALGLPAVRLIEADANLGFGAGCNRAVAGLPREARTILFLNPDARVAGHDVERLVGWLEEHPACALVGPRLRREGGPLTSAGREATFLTELRPLLPCAIGRFLPARMHAPDYDEPGPVGYVEGACMLVRRERLASIGGFDEGFFLYFEELDLARRFRTGGWTVDLCPDAWADHLVGSSTAHEPFGARAFIFESGARYLRKWHRWPVPQAYALAARVSWWARVRRGRLAPDAREAFGAALASGFRDR